MLTEWDVNFPKLLKMVQLDSGGVDDDGNNDDDDGDEYWHWERVEGGGGGGEWEGEGFAICKRIIIHSENFLQRARRGPTVSIYAFNGRPRVAPYKKNTCACTFSQKVKL